ncbi:MAG TPA: YdcF family protein [Crenalkalicoccus sp.]|nr:YdcF family protein [Crenalkalicoccus sp.]
MENALFIASKVFWFVVRPNTLALMLALVGLVLVWRGRRSGRWWLAVGLGYYLFILATPAADFLALPLEDRFPRPDPPPAAVTGVVVLGGAVDQLLTEARGIPALNGAAERMTEGVILARRYPEARLVFTGGQGTLLPGEQSEADVARALWTAMGVPPDRMAFENQSRNTWENAVLTRELVQPRRNQVWLLVTSAMHMPRAVGVFREAGFPVVPWPVNYTTGHSVRLWYDAPFPTRLNQFEAALREWVGLLAYRLLGRTDALFPAPQFPAAQPAIWRGKGMNCWPDKAEPASG